MKKLRPREGPVKKLRPGEDARARAPSEGREAQKRSERREGREARAERGKSG